MLVWSLRSFCEGNFLKQKVQTLYPVHFLHLGILYSFVFTTVTFLLLHFRLDGGDSWAPSLLLDSVLLLDSWAFSDSELLHLCSLRFLSLVSCADIWSGNG